MGIEIKKKYVAPKINTRLFKSEPYMAGGDTDEVSGNPEPIPTVPNVDSFQLPYEY